MELKMVEAFYIFTVSQIFDLAFSLDASHLLPFSRLQFRKVLFFIRFHLFWKRWLRHAMPMDLQGRGDILMVFPLKHQEMQCQTI